MDTPRLDSLQTEATDSLIEAIDRDTVEYLADKAATTIRHPEGGEIIDTLNDAVHELRKEGFGGSDYTSDHIEIYADAIWICHTDVRTALMDALGPFGTGGAFEIQGYPVLASDHVAHETILLVDPRALSENPVEWMDTAPLARQSLTELSLSIPMPVLVRSPNGLVAVELN